MRIIALVNNRVGWQAVQWLKEQGEEIAGLVIHPENRRKFGAEIIAGAAVPPERIFSGAEINRPEIRAAIAALKPDLGLSVYFGYILKPELLAMFPQGVINLHPSLLPYNRGANPDVWSIVEGTPAGVSLHYIDEGVDTGSVIAQKTVITEPVDTAKTLYTKLEEAALVLLRETWPAFKRGEITAVPQEPGAGSVHYLKDLEPLDRIDLDRQYQGRELVDLLRGRTFPPYKNTYFTENGRRVYVSIRLEYEDEPNQ
ncbi:MAG: methionyl-tRNA formyltransferase [Solirubrobacterales bacterium]